MQTQVVHFASVLTSFFGAALLADAFISYSRIDLAFALRLEDALIAAGQTVWLDKNDIPAAAPWLPEVQSGIDSADNFIFILSPDSVIYDPCMQELAHAITNGKRLVPVCYRKPEQSTVPVALAPINYIFFNETAEFDAAMQTLVAAMHTDLDWVRSHTFALAFAPSSDLLATAEFTGLYLWDAATGKLVGENVEPNRRSSNNLAFSPDGSKIALVLNGGEVLLVDTATQRLLGAHVLADPEDFLHKPSTVAFSHDGRNLYIRKGDGTVLQWNADPEDWAARACSVAGRNLSMEEWHRYIGDTIPYHRTCSQFPNGEGIAK